MEVENTQESMMMGTLQGKGISGSGRENEKSEQYQPNAPPRPGRA
jgi:hypothetical protein